MRVQFTAALLLTMITGAGAQVASHAPTIKTPDSAAALPPAQMAYPHVDDMPVARVNGAVLTNRDLVREMYTIFPYGRQHNGFPKNLEPQIRKGALDMIIFEELVYQEALRQKMTVPPARMARAEADFKKQFPDPKLYQSYIKFECQNSQQVLRAKIRRSLLIETLLKSEIQSKSAVTVAQARTYYDKNPQEFQHGETFSIQTISIIPPENANPDIQKEARSRAEEALRLAKATKSYKEFGLLAEKMSDDDWHVNMGDRKVMDVAKLPPPIVAAAQKMRQGDVSDLMQFGSNYTMFRLNQHVPAGRTKFEEVKKELLTNLQKKKYDEARSALGARLRKNAKIEVL
jgi:parvulin-like peptidyl-prolyl isomerase